MVYHILFPCLLDRSALIVINCFLCFTYDSIHSCEWPLMPYVEDIRSSSSGWMTVSKAAGKSSITMKTDCRECTVGHVRFGAKLFLMNETPYRHFAYFYLVYLYPYDAKAVLMQSSP